jgi:PIN domain nuclease of toxin-antitoxin system
MSDGPGRGYLLDTHIALWAIGQPQNLSDAAREAVLAGPNFLSVVAYWEVTIKAAKGSLKMDSPNDWWVEALDKLVATALPIYPQHVGALHRLPVIHKDPFDRIQIAQATLEGLTLVTADAEIARYASLGLRVVE